jgi:hypothetical protein
MHARGPGFMIEPDERALLVIATVPAGPFASFDDALRNV